jgi:hypothetical protein
MLNGEGTNTNVIAFGSQSTGEHPNHYPTNVA